MSQPTHSQYDYLKPRQGRWLLNTPHSVIIASDQAACLDDQILGKPGTKEKAIEQLSACRGRSVIFYTGLTLLNTNTGHMQADCVPFTVNFRALTHHELAQYIEKE